MSIAETKEGELLQLAWGIIANAGGGDWTRETPEWREAAVRWREGYHAMIQPPPIEGVQVTFWE